MSTHVLSNTGDWKLRFEDTQDIRGFSVLNQDGTDLGTTVDDLIIDTDEEKVVSIRLSDGSEYPARDISIGDGVVYITGDYDVNDPSLRRADAIEHFGILDKQDRPVYDTAAMETVKPHFERHFGETYGDAGGSFDDYIVVYQYGFERAHDDDHRNVGYADSESALRADFERRFPERNYDADLDAVRFGYQTAQRGSFIGRDTMM